MTIYFMGCGPSLGVPIVGCSCTTCLSSNPKNKRLRSSIVIKNGEDVILIDTTPDLRQQMLNSGIHNFKYVLYTHTHADHCHGIDDLRALRVTGHCDVITVYSVQTVLDELSNKFWHIFKESNTPTGFLLRQPIKIYENFQVGSSIVEPYMQSHGAIFSVGYKIGRVAYSTDVHYLPPESIEMLAGKIDVFIVGCIGYEKHKAHAHVDLCLEWANAIRPKLTILTHMDHHLEYGELRRRLPANVLPAYNGMVIEDVDLACI